MECGFPRTTALPLPRTITHVLLSSALAQSAASPALTVLTAKASRQASEHPVHVGGPVRHIVEEEVVALDLLQAEARRGEPG
eukprot:scaffold57906_cov43-Phaeocystis_antarctica.AAC.1